MAVVSAATRGASAAVLVVAEHSQESASQAVASAAPEVLLNGRIVEPGLALLQHADRIDVGDWRLWVSANAAPEHTEYEPSQHGDDVFCFRTKARLKPGEPIVICPGAPNKTCAMIYKATAWEAGIKCHNCGFDPTLPAWQPPEEPQHESNVSRLMEMVAAAAESAKKR